MPSATAPTLRASRCAPLNPDYRGAPSQRPRRLQADPPRLYRHARGSFCVRHQGVTTWFGSDPTEADTAFRQFLRSLPMESAHAANTEDMAKLDTSAFMGILRPRSAHIPLDDPPPIVVPQSAAKSIKVVADSLIALVDAES